MALSITQLTDKLVKQINERCITEKGKYFADVEGNTVTLNKVSGYEKAKTLLVVSAGFLHVTGLAVINLTFEDLCIIKLMILKQKLEKGAVK